MVTTTREAILLGTFSDADTSENPSGFIDSFSVYEGPFGSAANPLRNNEYDITYDDVNSDGKINLDNLSSSENISYSLGGSVITTKVDSLVVADAQVTYQDGSSSNYSNVVLFQDALGRLWLVNSNFAGTNINGSPGKPIQSVLISNVQDGYNALFQNALQKFVCFCKGTKILTARGERAVETLKVGDLIWTKDHGMKVAKWIGTRTLSPAELLVNFKLYPVRIKSGSLGVGTPERDLLVSPQHRILVSSRIAERMFGTEEVLVAAKHLTALQGIDFYTSMKEVTYFHLMFDQHEIIRSDGALTESFYPGPQAMRTIDHDALEELKTIFPDIFQDNSFEPCRTFVSGKRGMRLAERHQKNSQPLTIPEVHTRDHYTPY